MRRKKPGRDKSAVYLLVDPRNMSIRYVGLSTSPKARYRTHVKETAIGSAVYDWIEELDSVSVDPLLYIAEIIPEGSPYDPYKREKSWIKTLRSYGCPILNFYPGSEPCRLGKATPNNMNLPISF